MTHIAMRLFITSIFIAVLGFFSAESRASEALIPVGVAEVNITPNYPVRLSGFGGRRTESEGVTKKIWAKALAFSDDKDGPAILITAENVSVPDEITMEIARRLAPKINLRKERLTITATHTHTAPMLKNVCPTIFGVPIPPEHQKNIDRYTTEFIDALEKVALEAFASVRPARLSWAMGTAGFAANRRTKGGPVDHDLPMFAVHEPDGKVRAVYFSYACHCVTLSNNKISGDWAGFAQDAVEELFPGTIAMASVGCGADSNPSSGVTGDNTKIVAEQGDEIAQEIKRLVETGLTPITSKPNIHYTRIDLPLAPARTRQEWERRAKQQDAVGHHARVNLERLDRGESIPDKINYPIQTWVFGNDLSIVFLPGEMVVDYSLRLKRQFDRTRLWVNGYSNDGRCYIPSERILKEGGYEGGDAMIYYDFPQKFAPGLEEKIIAAVSTQIPETFKAPPGTEGTRPLSPGEALRSFRTKPGLKIEIVAAEPLIQDPVAIDWGADGKLWVCEMHDYPSGMDANWQPGGRVKFLLDDNHDGQYDRATVFLENLPFPTGVTAWGRGVLVCAAPDILYAEDTNGDGKADKIEKLFTGFFTDNYQARVNSLNIGLDNWIYAANGLLGGKITSLKNSLFPAAAEAVDIRNRDFRFHPSRGTLETVGGLTQQGRVRDDWGHWFGTDNSRLLLHFPAPENYIRRNPHMPAPPSTRELTSRADGNRLFPTSPALERFNDPGHVNRATSACGLGIYRDTLLGDEFYGNAFTCEPVHNLVHREIVHSNLVVTSERAGDEGSSEFLSSRDNWFRPVQARSGPDGALYIVDMYRFLIEHPRWIPAARLSQIDVRAGADRGRIYRVVSADRPLRPIRDLTKLKGAELASALDTPNGIDRDRVQIELLLRQDKNSIPKLKELAAKAKLPQVRLHALAALDGILPINLEQVQSALKDSDPLVREHAVRLTEPFLKKNDALSTGFLKAILPLTNDPSLLVLRQLAFTLGESPSSEAGRALGLIARAWLTNVEIRTAVLSSAVQHCGDVLTAVMTAEESAPGRADWIAPLIATAANSQNVEIVLRAIRASLPKPGTALDEVQMSALATLLENAERRGTSLEKLLDAPTNERVRAAIASANTIAADNQSAESKRRAAINLLGRVPSDESLALLTRTARDPSENLRRAAIASLKRWKSPAIAKEILSHWREAGPIARAELVSLLLERDEWSLALLEAVEGNVVQPLEISRADCQRLASIDKPQIRDLAAKLLPVEAITGRAKVLDEYKVALNLTGSASAGAAIFEKNCASCHALNGLGHHVGPDLAPLRPRDMEYWIKNILDPNAVIEPRFVNYQIELKDDRSLSGLIKNENANSLTIVSGSGASETISRADIASIRASTLSLMPEGLEQGIAPQQMADLIAFVRSGNPRKEIEGNKPQLVQSGNDGVLMLAAANAEIYGSEITFEPDFQNIGMWHGADDQVAWSFQVNQSGRFDVFLDYASAASASGNKFLFTTGDQSLSGDIAVTGDDWSHYKQIRIGSLDLSPGNHRAIFRAQGPIRNALIDLRTIALVPAGKKPKWPAAEVETASANTDEVLRDPVSVARFILDSSRPEAARSSAVNANPQFAAALIKEMTRDLTPGTAEEYARIPWIWRVAIACGKRNDATQIREVIKASVPADNQPLRDWQAVVLGGGVINGLSQRGLWPAERIDEILGDDKNLHAKWTRALDLSAAMADSEKIPTGTRYDALRMIALQGWKARGAQLLRYLAKGTHPELQMGAVSGLADINTPEAAAALKEALSYLEGQNRELATAGVSRAR
jgi:putative membrane-bound dehydrogenase-like protein